MESFQRVIAEIEDRVVPQLTRVCGEVAAFSSLASVVRCLLNLIRRFGCTLLRRLQLEQPVAFAMGSFQLSLKRLQSGAQLDALQKLAEMTETDISSEMSVSILLLL